MKKVHDYLWPQMIITNNAWQDQIFEAHCYGWSQIVLSSGAGAGKSLNAAKVAVIWWLADPQNRAAVISSTTLDSLESRIWGYAIRLLNETAIEIPFHNTGAKPPKVVYPGSKSKLAGMFAVAIREGSDSRTISTSIGKHPRGGLMVILDEATDITANFLKAIPNLEQGIPYFQLMAIGNASSKHDVHGGLATPLHGWNSIHPDTHSSWPTSQPNSICIYFNPHTSPAILETDPLKKEALSQFLITTEKMESMKKKYGADSDSYYRFVLGFWQTNTIEEVIITEEFLRESGVRQHSEWSGLRELIVIAGLDPAIATGKKGCVLRFAILGHSVSGKIVLDFKGTSLIHYIDIQPSMEHSAELQMVDQVIELLNRYGCSIYDLAIDSTGLGRAVGELLKLRAKSPYNPVKMLSTRTMGVLKEKDPDLFTIPPIELWITMRNYIQYRQIKGLDELTCAQLSNRKLIKDSKGKQSLETKTDYMARMSAVNPAMAHSPNEADAAALCLQAAIIRREFMLGQEIKIHDNQDMFSEKYSALMAERQARERLSQDNINGSRIVRHSPRATFGSSIIQYAQGSMNRKF